MFHLCIYHILFISQSVDRHLSYFHILTIVNNTSLHTDVQYLFELPLSILLVMYLEIELLHHMVILSLTF